MGDKSRTANIRTTEVVEITEALDHFNLTSNLNPKVDIRGIQDC